MTDAEFALLQFVALALPAVAILMQAIMQYHESQGRDFTSDVFWEFPMMGISFTLLVFSGVFLGFSVIENMTSPVLQTGVILFSFSLVFLVIPIWFAVFRGVTPPSIPSTYNSAIVSGAMQLAFVVVIIAAVVMIVPDIPEIPFNISLLFGLILILVVQGFALTILKNVTVYRRQRRKADEWSSRIKDCLGDIENSLNELELEGEPEVKEKWLIESTESLHDLGELVEDVPAMISKEKASETEKVKRRLDQLEDMLDRLEVIRIQRSADEKEIVHLKETREMLHERIEEKKEEVHELHHRFEEQDNLDARYEFEDAREDLKDLEEKVNELNKDINAAESLQQEYLEREKAVRGKIEKFIDDLSKDIENILQEL